MADQTPPHSSVQQLGAMRSFLRLVSLLGPYRWHVLASTLLGLGAVSTTLFIPSFTGKAVDAIEAGSMSDVRRNVELMIGLGVVSGVMWFARRMVGGAVSLGLERDLRDRLLRHLSWQRTAWFDMHSTGQLLSRLTVDVTSVRFFLGYGLLYFITHVFMLLGVGIMVWSIEPRLALAVYVTLPLLTVVSYRYGKLSHLVLRDVQQREADVTQAAEETITGVRIVRSFGQEDREIERMRVLSARVAEGERDNAKISARYQPLYAVITNGSLLLVVLLSHAAINTRGTMTIGDFFAFWAYMALLVGPIRIVGSIIGRAQRATASASRLFEVLDDDQRLAEAEAPKHLPADGAGSVRLRNVQFAYGTSEREGDRRPRILHDIDLNVPAGSTLALLGATGSGKSTVAALLPRLYDPDSGSVEIDGIDVRELPLDELRRAVSIVDQEPYLFSTSVREAIAIGDPDMADADIEDAARAAQADEFIEKLPDRYDTVVGERGLTLSGGQRQRLAIARALATQPRVLVLDDATASVDARVEQEITDALAAATRGRTTILIAHRPSTVRLADHIAILDEGRIVDSGTHDELITRNAFYQLLHGITPAASNGGGT